MSPITKLFLDKRHGLLGIYTSAKLVAGLDKLHRQGVIKLRIEQPTLPEKITIEEPDVILLQVFSEHSRASWQMGIDLRDRSDVFTLPVLNQCDVYLKRNFHRPHLRGLPEELACKVQPFGLNYACRTFASAIRVLRRTPLALLHHGSRGLSDLYCYLNLPNVADFEQCPDAVLEPMISFQTRVWEEWDTVPGEAEAINEERVAVIRALKEAFGDRFFGGLVPTPLALARYPGEVSAFSTRRRRYTAMNKKCLIGVYTRGLHDSVAFKLAESLAAAQCIVAEPLRNELPVPLEAGKHFLAFQTPEECVAAFQRLLKDQELASQMRQANHAYYCREVEPAAHVLRILERHTAYLGTRCSMSPQPLTNLALPDGHGRRSCRSRLASRE